MKRAPFEMVTLKNGLSLITQTTPVNSVAIYVSVGAGSRFETRQTMGVAHFLEHMLFEGTKHLLSAKNIAEYIENVGGRSGAWTDKEYVSYHVKVPTQQVDRGFSYLSEILFRPTLDEKAIQKEKGIIFEEIKRKVDNPEIDIWDLWLEWVWGEKHSLGRSTLSDESAVARVTRKQLQDYLVKFYHPANMTIAVVGNFSPKEVKSHAIKYFGHISSKNIPNFENVRFVPKKIHTKIIQSDAQQAQFVLGFVTGISYTHRDRFVQQLIADLLSGGVSSRLSHRLIYELGIVYSTWAQSWVFRDTGLFYIYGGVSPKNLRLAMKIILEEIKRIQEKKVSKKELQQTKDKAKANIMFSLETPEAIANWYASQQITEKRITTIDEFEKRIDEVTSEDIMRFAHQYFSSKNISLTIKGPVDEDRESFEKLLTTL